jgi:hypothetical protein
MQAACDQGVTQRYDIGNDDDDDDDANVVVNLDADHELSPRYLDSADVLDTDF